MACFCLGCQSGTIKDPNNVATAGPDTPAVIMNQLHVAAESLNMRMARGEINKREYDDMMVKLSQGYLADVKDKTVTDQNARTWGQVYTNAHDWKDAEPVLKRAIAVEARGIEDYRVLGNWVADNLLLAQVQAQLGDVHNAVATTRTVFNVPPKAKTPILTSVLYFIAPAGAGKGDDLELANLIKDAIEQHQQVIVDPNTDAGRDFLLARPHHIHRAWEEAAILYSAAGRRDLAEQALQQLRASDASEIKL